MKGEATELDHIMQWMTKIGQNILKVHFNVLLT